MRLLTSASGLKVRSGAAWLLTLASMSLPLGLLSGCGDSTSSTSTSPSTSTSGGTDTGSQSGRVGELAYVTDAEMAKYVDGTPDHAVKFPTDNYDQGRKLLLTHKYDESEKVLKEGLDAAVKSSAGETKLGQYCVRVCNALYQEGLLLKGKDQQKKYSESLKYAILASKIFYKQPPAQRPMAGWFFNVHMHMGFCYKYLGNYPEAEAQLRKAINVAASAPAGQEDWPFHRLCYIELIDTLAKDHKVPQSKQLKEELKTVEDKHNSK